MKAAKPNEIVSDDNANVIRTVTYCLVCGKRSDEHDAAEMTDCGEAWARLVPMIRGDGYEGA